LWPYRDSSVGQTESFYDDFFLHAKLRLFDETDKTTGDDISFYRKDKAKQGYFLHRFNVASAILKDGKLRPFIRLHSIWAEIASRPECIPKVCEFSPETRKFTQRFLCRRSARWSHRRQWIRFRPPQRFSRPHKCGYRPDWPQSSASSVHGCVPLRPQWDEISVVKSAERAVPAPMCKPRLHQLPSLVPHAYLGLGFPAAPSDSNSLDTTSAETTRTPLAPTPLARNLWISQQVPQATLSQIHWRDLVQ
jgi:hypothetical protein